MKKNILPFLAMLSLISAVAVSSCKKDESNGAPTITSVAVNPNSVNANGIVAVSVTATDPENDPLTYAYTVTGGSISGTGSAVT